MNIALLTAHTRDISNWAQLGVENKRAYCAVHNYTLLTPPFHGAFDEMRAPTWSKIKFLQSYLKWFDWVFWSDADSLITNPTVPLEPFTQTDKDLVISTDYNSLNAGHFLLRNCPWSFEFLQRIWDSVPTETVDVEYSTYEQGRIIYSYENNLSDGQHFHVLPPRVLNSDPKLWREGDFLIHFFGYKNHQKAALMKQWSKKF